MRAVTPGLFLAPAVMDICGDGIIDLYKSSAPAAER